ncbi:MAG: MATE family efflux transporter [Lachnospiraceae bacterium]|nr:MATE family efflux transporter [Lachnospiraceae bacterium]
MEKSLSESEFFGTERIGKILLKIAPPVMLAQLIQALYNIVDSFFVGRYSADALTALTVIYPLQLIIIAFAVGTGVGVNTYMARKFAQKSERDAENAAGTGTVLAVFTWALFALLSALFMRKYVMSSAKNPLAVEYAVTYGKIVCIGSIGAFLEGNWTKVHQAGGNMRLPMIAQIIGAFVNIILDPFLIFGIGFFPELGVAGAAYATVLGQVAAAAITGIKGLRRPPKIKEMAHYARRIYWYGYSSILMQALYTVYIVVLNIILAGFSDAAVTVLGLYYKMQSFFFIPLIGLQTCIVPILSFNYTRMSYDRCRRTMKDSFLISAAFMIVGMVCFIFFPERIMRLFSDSEAVHEIGKTAFPIIGTSFISAVFSLIMPVFFQAVGNGVISLLLSLTRQIFCLMPIFWLFSLIGLDYAWLAFPVSETIAGGIGLFLYFKQIQKWKTAADEKQKEGETETVKSKL